MNGCIEGKNIYSVITNDYQAVYDSVSELIQAGRKKILFISDSYSYSAMNKQRGYENALKAHGLPVLGERKIYMKNDIHMVRDLLLARRDLDFDAVVASEDGIAVGVLKYAKARMLSVPEDLSIIGYNNSELSIGCEPELTSVDGRGEILCKVTIDSMMEVLGGKKIDPLMRIDCRLVKRCTTDF